MCLLVSGKLASDTELVAILRSKRPTPITDPVVGKLASVLQMGLLNEAEADTWDLISAMISRRAIELESHDNKNSQEGQVSSRQLGQSTTSTVGESPLESLLQTIPRLRAARICGLGDSSSATHGSCSRELRYILRFVQRCSCTADGVLAPGVVNTTVDPVFLA